MITLKFINIYSQKFVTWFAVNEQLNQPLVFFIPDNSGNLQKISCDSKQSGYFNYNDDFDILEKILPSMMFPDNEQPNKSSVIIQRLDKKNSKKIN